MDLHDILTAPLDPTGLTDDELSAARQARIDAFNAVRNGEAELPEGVTLIDAATLIVEQAKAIDAEAVTRSAAKAELDAALDGLADQLAVPEVAPAVEPEPAVEPAVEPVAAEAPAVEPVPELVAASVKAPAQPLTVRPQAFAGLPTPPEANGRRGRVADVTMKAAADFNTGARGGRRRITAGTEIDWNDLGHIAHEASRTVSTGSNGDGRLHFATISAPFGDDERLTGDPEHDSAVIERATLAGHRGGKDSVEAAEALTAAGHCAPPIYVYEFCELQAIDGLWDVPSVQSERGSIAWPITDTLADWMTRNADWLWTAVEDGDEDETKEVYEMPCPTHGDACEVEDHYLAVKFKNMQARSWPESYAHKMRLALVAHRYRIQQRHLANAINAATAVGVSGAGDSAFSAILSAVELQVMDLRDKYGTELDMVMEAAFPTWTRAAMRADLSRRNGVDLRSVTDVDITRAFTDRGVRPQFVRRLQDLGGVGAATAWPTDLSFLLYPAGTFIEQTQGRLDLGMEIRDMSLIQRNEFAGFVEDSSVLCNPCFEARYVTVGDICVSGLTGAADINCPIGS